MTRPPDTLGGRIWLSLFGLLVLQQCCQGIQQLLNTDSPLACGQPQNYQPDSVFLIKAKSAVTGSKCEITFTEFLWSDLDQQCFSICIKISNYSLHSCDFKMTYHDGLGDVNPRVFDCHSFPPLLWCSSKRDLKIVFKEQKKYRGEGYFILMEVKPYCKKEGEETTSNVETSKTYVQRLNEEEQRQRDTVIITGSLVSTVSFILVIFWVTYCCWKRQNTPREQRSTGSSSQGSASSRGQNNKPPGTSPNNRVPVDSQFPVNLNNQPQHWYPMHALPPGQQNPQCQPGVMHAGYQQQADTRYTKLPELKSNKPEESLFVPPGPHRGSPTKDHLFNDDSALSIRQYNPENFCGAGGHNSYDADVDMSYNEQPQQPPPLPPRPNFPPYQSKQYFI